jgi:exodeoxyribonuclease VII small subunit
MKEEKMAKEAKNVKNGEKTEAGFEERLGELEAIAARLEKDDVPLEEALALYERGMTIHRACEKILNEAKLRIERLAKEEEIA